MLPPLQASGLGQAGGGGARVENVLRVAEASIHGNVFPLRRWAQAAQLSRG
jgi:hypothetical protein